MNNIMLFVIKAVENNQITIDTLCNHLDIERNRLEFLLLNPNQCTKEEQEILEVYWIENENLELATKVNQIARKIPIENRKQFIQALSYLADCFEKKD